MSKSEQGTDTDSVEYIDYLEQNVVQVGVPSLQWFAATAIVTSVSNDRFDKVAGLMDELKSAQEEEERTLLEPLRKKHKAEQDALVTKLDSIIRRNEEGLRTFHCNTGEFGVCEAWMNDEIDVWIDMSGPPHYKGLDRGDMIKLCGGSCGKRLCSNCIHYGCENKECENAKKFCVSCFDENNGYNGPRPIWDSFKRYYFKKGRKEYFDDDDDEDDSYYRLSKCLKCGTQNDKKW